jgi:hypothetical protein
MMFLAPTGEPGGNSLEFGGVERSPPTLTSHINTALQAPSSVILRPSMTAMVDQSLHQEPQTLLFR